MNAYVILFLVCVLGFAWRWHNQPASPRAEPDHSPNPDPMDDKHTFAPQSHDTVLPLLAGGALLAGNAFGAQPSRAFGSPVATTAAAAAMQMTTNRVASKTAAPTPDPAETPRVGTKPVINDEPQRRRFSHEPFRSEFHNNSVASRSEHTLYSWMRGYFPLDLA